MIRCIHSRIEEEVKNVYSANSYLHNKTETPIKTCNVSLAWEPPLKRYNDITHRSLKVLTLEVTTGPNSARAICADCAHGARRNEFTFSFMNPDPGTNGTREKLFLSSL